MIEFTPVVYTKIGTSRTYLNQIASYPHPQQWQLLVQHDQSQHFLEAYLHLTSDKVQYADVEYMIHLVNQKNFNLMGYYTEFKIRFDENHHSWGTAQFIKVSDMQCVVNPQDQTLKFYVYMKVVDQRNKK